MLHKTDTMQKLASGNGRESKVMLRVILRSRKYSKFCIASFHERKGKRNTVSQNKRTREVGPVQKNHVVHQASSHLKGLRIYASKKHKRFNKINPVTSLGRFFRSSGGREYELLTEAHP
jgi:hypothetical protein